MDKEQIAKLPKIVELLLDKAVMVDVKDKLLVQLKETCELAMQYLDLTQ